MPWFRHVARHPRIQPTVLLCHDHGLEAPGFDPGFGRPVRWDVPLLDGLEVVRLRNHAPRPGVGRFFGIFNLGLPLALSRNRYDAVVIHGWNYACYPLALLSARLRGLPVLMRGESPLLPGEPDEPATARARLRRWLRQGVLRPYLSLCAGALAVSSGNRRLLLQLGMPPERIFFSPYAVEGERFCLPEAERAVARAQLRAELAVGKEVPLIVSVGKLQPIKEPLLLLSAYARLRAQGIEAALAYVGDGELRAALTQAARSVPDVHLLGFRNQSELPALYAAADLLVLPSRRETFGLVINEAMHAGLPVICSDGVGCAEDLVRPGETGLVFPRGNEDRLMACLVELCHGPAAAARRERLGRAARERIQSWTFEQATAGLLGALDALPPPPSEEQS